MEVYLDNSATTKSFEDVAQLVATIMCRDYGNPSSLHNKGMEANSMSVRQKRSSQKILR